MFASENVMNAIALQFAFKKQYKSENYCNKIGYRKSTKIELMYIIIVRKINWQQYSVCRE